MKKTVLILAASMVAGSVIAEPILWDFVNGRAGSTNAAVVDFTLAGVTEDLSGASVSHVDVNSAITNAGLNGVTLSFLSASAGVNNYAYNKTVGDGAPLVSDYLYIRSGTTTEIQIGGLAANLMADTDYSLYLWGAGDSPSQGSTFVFGGVTNVTPAASPVTANAADFMVKYTFNTGATVADTLEFNWNGANNYNGFNGFAIATDAIPEPATLGLFGLFGGAFIFIRRRFKI